MNFNVPNYVKALEENQISVMYCGPIWKNSIDDIAEMLQHRLDFDSMSFSASQSVFSVFVEQMNNMLQYSMEKKSFELKDGDAVDVSKGTFILGFRDKTYFIYTGNLLKDSSAAILKERIDYLNSLEKKDLRKYYKERMKAENDNPESKGAGLGLIEVARRATSKIAYEFQPRGEGMQYFIMYVEI